MRKRWHLVFIPKPIMSPHKPSFSLRCLAEKVSDADFGEVCRKEVVGKLQRRQANWKLDPPLRKACKEHVFTYCDAEDKQGQACKEHVFTYCDAEDKQGQACKEHVFKYCNAEDELGQGPTTRGLYELMFPEGLCFTL
ncbi:hypothetical protein DUNSADRAFT_9833 [Dunaliella salina]|uniref:Uncharacterized protein n=1 Tax=Dunaliella salina TaxID=3046 RepID=A0ABQ7GGL7_DUNSA|nr:hypothetical protein DUNSADRAFT_9833 [Dunaliella salina]|eukprot:KAF5833726.1 hypothetical protein DUNSADRAFT_9833 [Dunaliella salina]